MTSHKEPDPEGDSADAAEAPQEGELCCASCGGLKDEEGCINPECIRNPYYEDDEDDAEEWDGTDQVSDDDHGTDPFTERPIA